MNMLAALFAGAALLAGAVLAGYRMRTRGPAAAGKSVLLAGFAGVLLVSSLGVYATLGRWSDWDKAEVDHDVDYLLAAKLTDARRLVQMTPDSAYAQQQLALVSLEVGRYEDAVSAIDRSISIAGETPELLGIKVFAQYYRDGRQFAPETQAAVGRVFDMNPLEVRTRMLLGQDAFLNGRYAEAVGHWRMLLDAGAAPDKERALKTAIAKAEARMTR